jgi:hypothetical protein
MKHCPNCGQPTARTEDWACQWCGYPLLSDSYKKIPKTYKQLKDELRHEQEPDVSVTPEPAPPPTPATKPEPEPQPEPTPEIVPEPEPAPKTEPVLEKEPVFEPEPAPQVEPVLEAETEPVSEPETEEEIEPELATIDVEITVERLRSAYGEEGTAADAKFINKTLKITGVVDKIEIQDALDIHYIIINSEAKSLLQNVRCHFNRKHASELNQLTIGQTVTVQGTFDGSIMDLRMRDCFLVR